MNTSEVLNRAADLIEERGWTQGGSGWGIGGQALCLEGGILAALGYRWEASDWSFEEFPECPAYTAVADYLDYRSELYQWNDEGNRTADEVIEALRAAAVIEAAKETADVREPVSS
jgi:hypothetical protein